MLQYGVLIVLFIFNCQVIEVNGQNYDNEYKNCTIIGNQAWYRDMNRSGDGRYICMQSCTNTPQKIINLYYATEKRRAPLVSCKDKFPALIPHTDRKFKKLKFMQCGRNFYTIGPIVLSWYGARQWCRSRNLEMGEVNDKFKELEMFFLFGQPKKVPTQKPKGNKTEPPEVKSPNKGPIATTKAPNLILWVGASDHASPGNNTYWDSSGERVTSTITLRNKSPSCLTVKQNEDKLLILNQENCKSKLAFFCVVPRKVYLEECFALYTNSTALLPNFNNLFNVKYNKKSSLAYQCEKKSCPSLKISEAFLNPATRQSEYDKIGVQINACGKRLIFSHTQKYFPDPWQDCGKINMSLIVVQTKTKADCLAELFEGTNQLPMVYYTAGNAEKTCTADYIWCGSKEIFSNSTNSSVPWLLGEPSQEGEFLLALYLSKDASGIVEWCIRNPLPYICEADLENESQLTNRSHIKYALTQLIPKKINEKNDPISIMIKKSSKNYLCPNVRCPPWIFARGINYLKIENDNLGHLITVRGKKYLLSHIQVAAFEAFAICCSVGMQLAVVETKSLVDAIFDAYAGLGVSGTSYWISIVDDFALRNFTQCDDKLSYIPEELWLTGEPNNGAKKFNLPESCVVLRLSPSGLRGFADRHCFFFYNYMCEEVDYTALAPVVTTTTSPATTATLNAHAVRNITKPSKNKTASMTTPSLALKKNLTNLLTPDAKNVFKNLMVSGSNKTLNGTLINLSFNGTSNRTDLNISSLNINSTKSLLNITLQQKPKFNLDSLKGLFGG